MDLFAAMRAFVAVADSGGFAPAARRMGLATSSLTRQVDALEARLGAVLLNRSTRRLTLTPAGESYSAQATRILADVEEAGRSLGERDGVPHGLLRVSLPVVFARLHVTPIVPDFLATFPGIELELVLTDTPVDLVEARIDVAIRLGVLDSSSLIARRLAGHRRRLCAAPAYFAAHGVPQTPADLAQHRCLTFAYAGAARHWRFERDGRQESVAVRGPLRCNDSDTLRQAALAGVGLVLLPTWLVGGDLAAGLLAEGLPDWTAEIGRAGSAPQSDAGVFALYLRDRRQSPKVRAFVDFLAARFDAAGTWG